VNFYKHHLGDYAGATAHLSWDEDMAYTRLLRVYYRKEAPIPHVDRYRLTRAISKAQKAAVDAVLQEFFTRDGDLWRQKRCDEEIEAYQAQAATNKRIARERTVGRNGNESSTNRSPVTHAEREPKQNHETEPEKRTSPQAARPDAAKDEIWKTGRALLAEMDKDRAGSFLGKLCKDYGQVLVLQAIRDCALAKPVKASEWLVARCQERRASAGNKQVQLEERNRKATAGWMPPELREKHAG
jgi:uncharacterized protein YdaU (DUF1376 family)